MTFVHFTSNIGNSIEESASLLYNDLDNYVSNDEFFEESSVMIEIDPGNGWQDTVTVRADFNDPESTVVKLAEAILDLEPDGGYDVLIH